MAASEYNVPAPDDRATITCLYCERPQEVSRKAMSVTCKYCNKSLKLEDILFKQYTARRTIDTCGVVTIEKHFEPADITRPDLLHDQFVLHLPPACVDRYVIKYRRNGKRLRQCSLTRGRSHGREASRHSQSHRACGRRDRAWRQ